MISQILAFSEQLGQFLTQHSNVAPGERNHSQAGRTRTFKANTPEDELCSTDVVEGATALVCRLKR